MRPKGDHRAPAPEPVRLGRAVCGRLAESERREWWIANGRGGYAAGTVAGTLTRRYHGLLIAAVDPPLGRRLVFAKADATLSDGTHEYPLFANRWSGGQIAPPGHFGIESFHLDHTVPVWMFAIGGRRVEARIWMEPGEDTTYLAWFCTRVPARAICFLCASRCWSTTVTIMAIPGRRAFSRSVTLRGHTRVADGDFTLSLRAVHGKITPQRTWYRNFDLPIEAERGLGSTDSHLCVGSAEIELRSGVWCGIIASLGPTRPMIL